MGGSALESGIPTFSPFPGISPEPSHWKTTSSMILVSRFLLIEHHQSLSFEVGSELFKGQEFDFTLLINLMLARIC